MAAVGSAVVHVNIQQKVLAVTQEDSHVTGLNWFIRKENLQYAESLALWNR